MIFFSPTYRQFNDSFVVYVTIERNNTLNIQDYLRRVGLIDDKSYFLLDIYPVRFQGKINRFFQFLGSSFQDEHLKHILIGKEWMDIPFDWQGYK